MIIFDGIATAASRELVLAREVAILRQQGKQPTVAALVFTEDAGSLLYTRLKREAAERVGIIYQPYLFSLTDTLEVILPKLEELNQDPQVTGIIIQKPTKQVWQNARQAASASITYAEWWQTLTQKIAVAKDVDGLHPTTLSQIAAGTWQEQGSVLPATCQAVVDIIAQYPDHMPVSGKAVIIGKSDLLGTPLAAVLAQQGRAVELLTRKEFAVRQESGQLLLDAQLVVSATGVPKLITGSMLSPGVAVIDVGEPKADVDKESVAPKAVFLTPVPGGVGPMTVVSLLGNAVTLLTNRS